MEEAVRPPHAFVVSTCADRQRSTAAIDHHLAASYAFKLERRWRWCATWLPVGAVVIAPALVIAAPTDGLDALAGGIAGLTALLARVVGGPKAEAHHLRGVKELEARDCAIFGLQANTGLGPLPQAESTKLYAESARRLLPDEESRAATWYEFSDAASEPFNVLIAQRSSVAWGENEHEHWANALVLALVVAVLGGVSVAAAVGASLVSYLGLVAFPSVMGWLEIWDLQVAHRRAAHEKRDVRRRADHLVETRDGTHARELQDAIFRGRLLAPYVPQWYYKLRRDRNDRSMRSVAQDLSAGDKTGG